MEDVVDTFYLQFVRPLGNLVIIYAQAEWSLIELISECEKTGERAALEILKGPAAKKVTLDLVSRSGLEGYDLEDSLNHVSEFWISKDMRNRYIHDEWFPNILSSEATVTTRGIPPKKGSDVIWDDPTPQNVWALAVRFREHKSAFSYGAYKIRQLRQT